MKIKKLSENAILPHYSTEGSRLGVQMMCKMCAKEFKPYGRDVTCSPECSYQLKLQSHRAWWQRSGKFKRDKYEHYLDNQKRRIKKRIRSKYENQKDE